MLFMSCVFMLSRLFIVALWSSAGKGLTSWFLFVMFGLVFVTFPCGILGQVWYLILSISDLCRLSYFDRVWHAGLLRNVSVFDVIEDYALCFVRIVPEHPYTNELAHLV